MLRAKAYCTEEGRISAKGIVENFAGDEPGCQGIEEVYIEARTIVAIISFLASPKTLWACTPWPGIPRIFA